MDKKTSSSLRIHTAMKPDSPEETTEKKPKTRSVRIRRASFSERLLRNTAVACSLLLSIMALKNIDTPFTDKVTDTIKSVVNMDFEIDKSIGEMSFVQKVMPKSALVFLNMSPSSPVSVPVSGTIFHPYSKEQPWTEFHPTASENILSLSEGTVTACVRTESSDWTILIDHTDGTQAVYAFVSQPLISPGDHIYAQSAIGLCGEGVNARLYLEYRVNGKPEDPAKLLKGYNQ